MSILHLVSGQTLPNMLPLLATDPKPVTQFCSGNENFRQQALWLEDTMCEQFAWPKELFETHFIKAISPDIDETILSLEEVHRRRPISVINLTGGTKLISLGAYQFAQLNKIPAFYVDTELRRSWVNAGGLTLPEWLGTLESAVERLTVKAVITAYGLPHRDYKSDELCPELLRFATATCNKVLQDNRSGDQERTSFIKECRTRLHDPKSGSFLEKGRLKKVLERSLPAPQSEDLEIWLKTAEKAGILNFGPQGYYLPPAPMFNCGLQRLHRPAKNAWRTLEGGWWELAVIDAMQSSGRFIDVQWSVQSRGSDTSQALGENDIIALDRKRLSLVFVSCKVSDGFLHKPLEHVFATKERATQFGGLFAHCVFAFFEMHKASKVKILESACKVVKARLLSSEKALEQWLSN